MIIAYTILPFAYFWTLYAMYTSMKGLPEQKAIQHERKSILFQFIFFQVSYLTRTLMFILQFTAFQHQGHKSFYWQLCNLILYIPWNVLPISYILYCHAWTYSQVLEESKRMPHKSTGTDKQILDEVVCKMLMADVDGSEEPDQDFLMLENQANY